MKKTKSCRAHRINGDFAKFGLACKSYSNNPTFVALSITNAFTICQQILGVLRSFHESIQAFTKMYVYYAQIFTSNWARVMQKNVDALALHFFCSGWHSPALGHCPQPQPQDEQAAPRLLSRTSLRTISATVHSKIALMIMVAGIYNLLPSVRPPLWRQYAWSFPQRRAGEGGTQTHPPIVLPRRSRG